MLFRSIENGTYTIEATLSGGSGRASIENPIKITVNDNEITATIIWSSKFYEFMQIGEEKFMPVTKTGNATFEVPIILDKEMKVSAQTVAMSEPHLIEYALFFDSKTLKKI